MPARYSDLVAGPPPSVPATWLGAWETSADCAYCRDRHGRIVAVNAAFARRFGSAPADCLGRAAGGFVHADDLAAFEAACTEALAPPHHAACEHRWRTPQGMRWFAWEESGLCDDSGAVVAVRSVGRDITRQRLAEERLYRLSRAVEQSPVSTVITDPDGHAQYVNPKFTELTGHTLEDILDRNIEVLREVRADDAGYAELCATVRAGQEWRGEVSGKRGDGQLLWESVKVSCLRSPTGEITNFLCLREDITERKKLEDELRQAQKMESLGTLAGGIAHDFNNLLAIINGYAEFCSRPETEAAVLQKGLREIQRASLRASGLVRQILTFSRKATVQFSAVDLNQLIRDLVTLLAETFPRTVTFHLDLHAGLPPLHADQNQLQQVILNLCVNARDALPSGGAITLSTTVVPGSRLRAQGGDPARTYARLRAADTGSGMTPEVRARIFEPFFTTKLGNQGTGLGLAVVYGIVTGHHGFIDVESTPGAGTAFEILLPLAESAVPAVIAPPNGEFPRGHESLLIVDDEDALRTLLATAFTHKGYRTATAGNGLDAIERITRSAEPIDAVLLDINMPGATGLEVLKAIRARRPELKVLIISGDITASARAAFQALGQEAFVQKPYTLELLGRELRRLFDPKPAA